MLGGMRPGVIFSFAIPGGILPIVGRGPFELPVFAGIIVGGGFAGLRFAAGGLVLTIALGFRCSAFELTLVLLAPEQPAMTAAIAVVVSTVRYLIFVFALRLFSLP